MFPLSAGALAASSSSRGAAAAVLFPSTDTNHVLEVPRPPAASAAPAPADDPAQEHTDTLYVDSSQFPLDDPRVFEEQIETLGQARQLEDLPELCGDASTKTVPPALERLPSFDRDEVAPLRRFPRAQALVLAAGLLTGTVMAWVIYGRDTTTSADDEIWIEAVAQPVAIRTASQVPTQEELATAEEELATAEEEPLRNASAESLPSSPKAPEEPTAEPAETPAEMKPTSPKTNLPSRELWLE